MDVKVWQERVHIPTYEIGKSEKNPMFLEKRVYQGSSGVVYPYPVIEKISDVAVDKEYNALLIENEYIKVMVLPELGGRVQMAYDKIKDRHFIYYNHVIKPALVGLTGPWISGGIEINWPQHHRPSTFLPVDFRIEHLKDGGATIWVSERERMFHQKGMAGYTLRPGKAYLEIRGQLYNPTPFPQTFLWWANPAVHVNDSYQSVFPPDVNAVFDHGRRDVSTFPIATGTYYKVDYSAGVDISRYKNIPVPTSYMAVKSKYDFVGGYEHDTKAGVIHVANHNVSPGKKQWTWGCGNFGKAWDRNLTDNDGPYIELMTGMYCDNQPDFSWLQPYEEKTFTQYFIPYRELGVVKNACSDVLMNIEKDKEGKSVIKLFATSKQSIRLVVRDDTGTILDEKIAISPEEVLEKEVSGIKDIDACKVLIHSADGKMLLKWQSEPKGEKEIPSPAKKALTPREIRSTEQLFLTGQHIEQYRHATFDASGYYLEALRLDPTDIRNNNAMGLWLLRRGKFADSEKYFRTAVNTQLERNPNPYDGEPLYNLGLSLAFQGKLDEAYEYFYKSCWSGAWQASGYLSLARISVYRKEYGRALYEVDMSLSRNWHNLLARHLKCAILRKLERNNEALSLIEESLKQDRFNSGCIFERYLIYRSEDAKKELYDILRDESHNYEELALDYLDAGLFEECISVIEAGINRCAHVSPMLYYYMAYTQSLSGQKPAKALSLAANSDPSYCFPNRLEAILALTKASELNPLDPKAPYYLGNLWYDKRQYEEAMECWEKSAKIDAKYPTVLRNLSLGYFNKKKDSNAALSCLEQAFRNDPTDARVLMELDQLYKRLNFPHHKRLSFLENHKKLVEERDDLYLEYATLLNQTGRHEQAIEMIDGRKFHPWEGGEGKVPEQYQIARVELAKDAIRAKDFDKAIILLEQCHEYPENLGEGKLIMAQENDFDYFLGCAYSGKGEEINARHFFELASKGIDELSDAVYYNDQKPDKIFYQGLALKKLGDGSKAGQIFGRLIEYGKTHFNDEVRIDYFAVSLPDMLIWDYDMNKRNKVHCNYLSALGYLGNGDIAKAEHFLNEAYCEDVNHQGVQIHIKMLPLISEF